VTEEEQAADDFAIGWCATYLSPQHLDSLNLGGRDPNRAYYIFGKNRKILSPYKDADMTKKEKLEAKEVPQPNNKVNDTTVVRDIEIDTYLYECVQIEPEALEEEFIRLPADIAYWNEKYSIALREYLLAKLRADETKALVTMETREFANASGVKMTVGDLEAKVQLDDRVQDANLALVEAEAARQALRNRCDALMAKRDMLQSLGAKLRVEMMSDPVVRDQMIANKLTR